VATKTLAGMIIVAALLAMAACGAGSREQVRPTAHDFRDEDLYEIPAPECIVGVPLKSYVLGPLARA